MKLEVNERLVDALRTVQNADLLVKLLKKYAGRNK